MKEIIDNGELRNINKPARYVGGEVNQIIKDNAKYNVALCYPNTYEKAMSNYIVKLLYNNINLIEELYCKRCFAVERDFEILLRNKCCEIYTLEDIKSIRENDMLLFVIDNELDYTNFINMLNLANIELDKLDRKNEDPKILVFASNKLNTKPIERFADVVFNEENEQDNIIKILSFLNEYVNSNKTDVDIKYQTSCVIPSIKIDNFSIIIDLATIGNIQDTIDFVKKSIEAQGITKVSFINQDKIDNNKFYELVYRLKFNIDDIRIVVKKLDFAKFTPDVLNIILPCMEKSELKLNVSTCNKHLKTMLGLGMEKSNLLDNIKCIFKNGFNSIKLAFNIGLPNETYEDIDDIFNIAEEIVNIYSQSRAKEKLSLIVNINCYVPTIYEINKYSINNINKLDTKIRYINEKKYDPVIKVNVDTVDNYITKILLKNGEEDVSNVIIDAYRLGARFDGNSRDYNKTAWDKAIYDNSHITNKYIKVSSI